MGLNKKNKENNGFTLIELVVVIGILSILSGISLFYFNGVNRRAREVAAQNALLTIKKECETNYGYSLPLFYENIRLEKYTILSDGQNSCYGDSITGLISAVPEEKDVSPYYYYNFNDGELSCAYNNGEKLPISECNSNNLDKSNRSSNNYDPPKKYKCAEIGDWFLAQKLLSQGHFYLDRDKDGVACETLGRKLNKPENGEIVIKGCYDGDTCTSSEGEKIRLACIDTPELRGKKADLIPAKAARDYLNELVAGSTLTIRRITEDRYGRTVAELSKGPMNIQEHLVEKGIASIYERYSSQCEWSMN